MLLKCYPLIYDEAHSTLDNCDDKIEVTSSSSNSGHKISGCSNFLDYPTFPCFSCKSSSIWILTADPGMARTLFQDDWGSKDAALHFLADSSQNGLAIASLNRLYNRLF